MIDPSSLLSDKTLIETLILSSSSPVGEPEIAARLGYSPDVRRIVDELNGEYKERGLSIVEVAHGRWAARTRPECSDLCRSFANRLLKMSRAGYETLAVIAYFQPVTRGEIERVRGVSLSPGTLEVLIYAGFVRLGPRRATPGNPMTFVTTDHFLLHFNISSLDALPDRAEMAAHGLLSAERGLSISGVGATAAESTA
ncbi:SMC-Scp complex subunit ScpB [Pararhizobium sp. BT-229]|uniref:SMC-Scp complex subunit ScpB n=1 Tax=Pararhizobium sp. BT-229 TaxID=2986923 RepID=UPI0021F71D5D|nr:SMC-Scp complex subunit ScpB [Pararhizobium sp. BT-229]MCV9963807.1 SMC-Scp complex subunit ScpB [Pararhizobium sp. BT-229]